MTPKWFQNYHKKTSNRPQNELKMTSESMIFKKWHQNLYCRINFSNNFHDGQTKDNTITSPTNTFDKHLGKKMRAVSRSDCNTLLYFRFLLRYPPLLYFALLIILAVLILYVTLLVLVILCSTLLYLTLFCSTLL